MLINNVSTYAVSHASVRMDHSTAAEYVGGSGSDLSPAPLFLPPSFNKTLIIFPTALFFSCFVLAPPPPVFQPGFVRREICGGKKSRGRGCMGIFQRRDNRNAALTGAIELIRRLGSDNVITAVLRPLIPPPNLLCIRSRRWEEESGGWGQQSPLSKRGLRTNNASNLLTLQLWFPDIQLIGLAAQWKLNFFINFKQCCLFVLMYANAQGVVGVRRPGGGGQGPGMVARSGLCVSRHTWLLNLTVNAPPRSFETRADTFYQDSTETTQ